MCRLLAPRGNRQKGEIRLIGLVACLVINAAPGGYTELSTDVVVAARDIAIAPVKDRPYLRYLSLYAVPETERKAFLEVLAFAVNQVSRESLFTNPHHVGSTCYRVDIRDYGWSAKAWENLAGADPYYHLQIGSTTTKESWSWKESKKLQTYYVRNERGYLVERQRWVTSREKIKQPATTTKTKAIVAPWVHFDAHATLEKYTLSPAPIVRADWWIWQTGGQDLRGGAGYYDFLGVTSGADFEKMVGLDRKVAERVQKEVAAIIRKSGVTLRSRQVWRLQSTSGSWWESRDVFKRARRRDNQKRNAITQLDRDFRPDALEIFATLPNGLFALAAVDANNQLQATVPDTIASDHFASSNDRRIQPGASCMRCHTNGLQPLDDFSRAFYRDNLLASKDREIARRLERIYLGPLQSKLKRDVEDYADSLKRLNGWTAEQASKLYPQWYYGYEEADLDAESIAREVGVDKEQLLAAIKATRGFGSNVLLSLVSKPAFPIRREHFEEEIELFFKALGYKAKVTK